jgi:hypothetical protein
MSSPSPVVQEFFDRYARSRTALDIDAIGSQYAETFMTAGPNGVRVVERAAVVAAFPKGQAFLKSLGHTSTRVESLQESPMDDRYVMARAQFAWRFQKASEEPLEAMVDSTFILFMDRDALRIVFQHEHEDFQQVLRASGVLT